MKRIISTLLVCVLLLGCVFTLASCGKMISGTYELAITDDNKTTYEFSGKNVTKTTTAGIAGFSKSETVEGKYEINETEDGLEITFTWEIDGEEKLDTVSFSEGEENGTKYIKLAGVKFNKVD